MFPIAALRCYREILQDRKNSLDILRTQNIVLYRNVALVKTIRFLPNLWKALKALSLNFPKYTRGSAFKSQCNQSKSHSEFTASWLFFNPKLLLFPERVWPSLYMIYLFLFRNKASLAGRFFTFEMFQHSLAGRVFNIQNVFRTVEIARVNLVYVYFYSGIRPV